MVSLRVIGLNHKTAPVEEREKALRIFREYPGILLATCNRVELYQTKREPANEFAVPFGDSTELILQNLIRRTENSLFGSMYIYENEKAVRHLYGVASGLDSQILGETEILGQVKTAYLKSQEKDWLLDRLFEKAIEVGRRVREETGISCGNISIAGVAIAKARRLIGDSRDKKIMLIGTGKVSETILKTLLRMRISIIWIANRTYEKAEEMARKYGGEAVRFDRLKEKLLEADLVISSTSAPHLILRKEQIGKREKPLVIIDLAVPRDIDPKVAEIPGVTLLNIDDIKEEINFNLTRRKVEAVFAERIVEEEVRKFCERYALAPAAVV